MLKFVLLFILFIYLVVKVSGFIMKTIYRLMGGQVHQQTRASSRSQQKKPSDGNVNVDYMPKNGKHSKHYDGGEYVEYEEVKK